MCCSGTSVSMLEHVTTTPHTDSTWACRYFSGFFQHHPLLQQFDYYWRMEPDVHYYCDLDYDPFIFMQVTHQKYIFMNVSVL